MEGRTVRPPLCPGQFVIAGRPTKVLSQVQLTLFQKVDAERATLLQATYRMNGADLMLKASSSGSKETCIIQAAVKALVPLRELRPQRKRPASDV